MNLMVGFFRALVKRRDYAGILRVGDFTSNPNHGFVLRRRLVRTQKEYIGLVPSSAQVGDAVGVFKGGKMPLLVRPNRERWKFVGECYIHGIMKGQAWDKSKCRMMWFEIDSARWAHPKLKYKWLATVINVQVDLTDPEYPLSQASGGTLRLRGPFQTAYVRREDNNEGSNNPRMAGTEFRLPSGGDLTIYQDTTCPCQVPCGVCKGGMAFFTLGEYEKAANPGPPRTRYVHARVGLVICLGKVQGGFYRQMGWLLEHLSE